MPAPAIVKELVRRFCALQPKRPPTRAQVQSQIEATDRQNHRLLYDLYGMTEEEFRIVEGTEVG